MKTRLALGTNVSARNQEIGAESRKRQAAEQTQIEDKKSRNNDRREEQNTLCTRKKELPFLP